MRPHLTTEKPHGSKSDDAVSEREFWCEDCGKRVTVSTDAGREYGHARGCKHSIGQEASAA